PQSSIALRGVYVGGATNKAEILRGIYLPGPQAQGAKRRFGVLPSADRRGHRRRSAAPVELEMARLHEQGANRVDDDRGFVHRLGTARHCVRSWQLPEGSAA